MGRGRKLRIGDEIRRADDTWAKVESIIQRSEDARVYNFEIEDNHNYFVGQSSLLVHNNCDIFWKTKMNPKEVVRMLKKAGFEVVEQSGSHAKLRLPGPGKYVTVSMHKKDILKDAYKSIQQQVKAVLDDVAK